MSNKNATGNANLNNVEYAAEKLLYNHLGVHHKGNAFITGGKRIEALEQFDEKLVRIHDPFIIENVHGVWFANFIVGQRAIFVKVSDSLEDVTQSVIDLFKISEALSGDVKMLLKGFMELYSYSLIAEIVSPSDIAVYSVSSTTDDLGEFARILNSPRFRENSLVAVISVDDQTWTVKFETPEQSNNVMKAEDFGQTMNLIVDRWQATIR